MIRYVIELAVLHTLLIAGYWIFLKKEGQYGKLRTYLLGAALLSLLVPLFRLPSIQSLFMKENDPEIFTFTLNPVSYIQVDATSADKNNIPALYWIYALICSWFLYRIVTGVIYLVRLERKSELLKIENTWVRKVADLDGSFSFFNWIFINNRIETDRENMPPILKHEQAHVRFGHSYDLLFFQLFRMVFWWLPSAWYINKEIKKIHEYQADAYALKSYSVDLYSSILISSTLKSNGLNLASSFYDGLILKRLKAMKQNVSKIKRWKLGVLGILTTLLVVTFACNEEMDQEIKELGQYSNAISFDQLPDDMQGKLAPLKDKLVFLKVNIQEDQYLQDVEGLKDVDPKLIYSMNVLKDSREVFVAIRKEGENFEYVANQSKQDGEVFILVEEAPSFPGGMDAFYRYVGENIGYPKSAREEGITGRVYVQFIVEKDGSLSDIKTVKGIGGGCDEEAVRVIANAPEFIPGKQRGKAVRVRMVLPIIFSIAGSENLPTGMNPPDESLEEIVVVGYAETVNEKFNVSSLYDDGEWTGTVTNEDGEPLPGVNIVVAGSTSGTVSDLDGTFQIKARDDSELVLSFVGYKSVRLTNKK